MESDDVRPSPIAGRWYSSNPVELAKQLDGYIEQAKYPKINGDIVAVMAPHAGYIYSGRVAGHAFAAIQNLRPDLVIVLSPMHQPYRQNFLTSGHKYYWTPLGKIPVDIPLLDEVAARLQEKYQLELHRVRNDEEHSLEIELPFLQRIYQYSFELIPIMVRDLSLKNCESLGKAIAEVVNNKNVMLVISTDLSHFYSQSEAQGYDSSMLGKIERLDPAGVLRSEFEGTGFACGAGAVVTGMVYAKEVGANKGAILNYNTSYEETGDASSVVGYGAAAFIKI